MHSGRWICNGVLSFIKEKCYQVLRAELNPKAAKLDFCAYLVPFLVLNNIPKCKKSQSNHFLTTPTYFHRGGIADP